MRYATAELLSNQEFFLEAIEKSDYVLEFLSNDLCSN